MFVIITVYLEVMYDSTWMLSMLALELLLAAGMFFLSLYFRYHVRVWLDVKIPVAQKGEKIPVEVYVENQSRLPVSDICITIGYENKYGKYRERTVLEESIEGRTQKKLNIDAYSDYSGRVNFFVHRVQIWDYLRLFCRKPKVRSEVYVNVLPDVNEIPVRVTARTLNFPVEGDDYEKNRSGDDPSEIFQIREFREGDRISKVHWKMSARMGGLMTKEYSMPRGCKILFLLDSSRMLPEPVKMDRFLEMAVSVCFALLEAECLHYVAWYDQNAGRVLRHSIQKEEDIYEMLDIFLAAPVYEQAYDLEAAYCSRYPQGAYSTILRLDAQGNLECNKKMVCSVGESMPGAALTGFLLEV